jgi:hypothetical protein
MGIPIRRSPCRRDTQRLSSGGAKSYLLRLICANPRRERPQKIVLTHRYLRLAACALRDGGLGDGDRRHWVEAYRRTLAGAATALAGNAPDSFRVRRALVRAKQSRPEKRIVLLVALLRLPIPTPAPSLRLRRRAPHRPTSDRAAPGAVPRTPFPDGRTPPGRARQRDPSAWPPSASPAADGNSSCNSSTIPTKFPVVSID